MSRIPYLVLAAAVFALVGAAAGAAVRATDHDAPVVTHGVVVGDVTAHSAVVWARGDREGTVKVHLSGGKRNGVRRLKFRAADDYTGQALLTGLKPDTDYRYRVGSTRGSFETAPAADDPEAVRLAFGGDVAGQNVCRETSEGFPIMETIRGLRPDVFVGLGDMIYADNACDPVGRYGNAQVPGPGPAPELATFWAHWRYNRADVASQRLLASTSYVGVWDDHEVVNDFGPLSDTRSTPPYTPGVHLLPIGLEAFLDYTPIAVAANTPKRLYRSLRWGKHLELFVLDTRQYRDANAATDSVDRPKTMLGREQLTWLKESLAASDATWKVIVSSVPMSIPTGFPPVPGGRDGWANFDQTTGFEQELLDILRFMEGRGIVNTVWITTDVHFAEAFRYRPFSANPGFAVYELATGPLNAGIFPIREFDTTLNPEVLTFFGPPTAEAVTTWEQAKHWFNFGTLELDRSGRLTAAIVNTAGQRQFSLTLSPQ
jgi:alkaline phosphatase D